MPKPYLFDIKKAECPQPLKSIPNILKHRLANVYRVCAGEKPIDFWDTVPELLEMVKLQAKKNNESVYEVKEKVEITLTIGAVKGVEYGY